MKLINKKLSSLILGTTIGVSSIAATTQILVSEYENKANYLASDSLETINDSVETMSARDYIPDSNNNETISTTNGFISIDQANKTIKLVSYFGNIVWSYDLKTSQFLTTNSNKNPTINSFYVYYSATYDRVIVVGNANTTNGFFFQLNANNGSPFFVNNDPSITLETKFAENVITTTKDNFTSNPKLVSFVNDNIALVFSEGNLLEQNKIFKIDVSNNIYITVTNDSNINSLVANSKSTVVGFKNISENVNVLITRRYTNSITDGSTIDLFITNNNMVVYSSLHSGSSTIVYSHRSYSSLSVGGVSGSTLLNNNIVFAPKVRTSSNGLISQLYLPIIGISGNFLINFKITKTTATIGVPPYSFVNNPVFIAPTSGNTFRPSAFIYSEDKKRFYFSNALTTNGSFVKINIDIDEITHHDTHFTNISNDDRLRNSQIVIVSEKNSSNTHFLFEKRGTAQLTGAQLVDATKAITIYDISSPVVTNPYDEATKKGLFRKVPTDVTEAELISLLSITNYASSSYSVTLVNYPGTTGSTKVVANAGDGTLKFSLNLSIKKWWNSSESFNYVSNYDWTGFQTLESLSFSLVSNSSINEAKFNAINNLMATSFPSQITKRQILDNFIEYGSALSFTEDDVSINILNSSAQIKVITDQNLGTLSIDYNITRNVGSTSLPGSNISGSYVWSSFKAMKDWSTLSLHEAQFNLYKSTKYSSQIRVNDLVSSLNASRGFSLDPASWKWEPQYTLQSNKAEYIKNNINGIVTGKLTYLRKDGIDPPANLLPNNGVIDIVAGSLNSQGCKNLRTYFGDNSTTNNAFDFNLNVANQLASTLTAREFIVRLPEIVEKSSSVTNNWINPSDLGYEVISETATEVIIDIFVPDNAKTNLELEPNVNLILDSDWKRELLATPTQSHLFDKKRFTIKTNLAQFKWNYGIPETQTSIKASLIGDEGKKISSMLPSKYIESLVKDPVKGYIQFQDLTNLVLTSITRATEEFTISRIDLVPNDTTGELLVNYHLDFPNIVQNQTIKKTGSILLTDTRNVWQIIIFWIVVIALIALITIALFITISAIRKNQKKKTLFSTSDFRKKYKSEKK